MKPIIESGKCDPEALESLTRRTSCRLELSRKAKALLKTPAYREKLRDLREKGEVIGAVTWEREVAVGRPLRKRRRGKR